MGDDQEENIEMWKIKKVLFIYFVPFSFTYFFSFVSRFCLRRRMMRESPDDEKMRWLFLLFAPKAPPFECALFNPTRVVAFE